MAKRYVAMTYDELSALDVTAALIRPEEHRRLIMWWIAGQPAGRFRNVHEERLAFLLAASHMAVGAAFRHHSEAPHA